MFNLTFSTGSLVMIDRSVTPNVPHQAAALSDVSVSMEVQTKEFPGGKQVASTVARYGMKFTIKAKANKMSAGALARILGGSSATGITRVSTESPAVTSHAQTVAHAATFVDDLGVIDASGIPMKPVASNPQVGEYTVAAGVYTYSATEPGVPSVTYSYTDTTGTTTSVNNAAPEVAPSFEVIAYNEFTDELGVTNKVGDRFYVVVFTKCDRSSKRDDFGEFDLEGTCYARASDNKIFEAYRG